MLINAIIHDLTLIEILGLWGIVNLQRISLAVSRISKSLSILENPKRKRILEITKPYKKT